MLSVDSQLTAHIGLAFAIMASESAQPCVSTPGGHMQVKGNYPVFYPDVPSFIDSLQVRHDSLLEGVDVSQPEGAALKVQWPIRRLR